MSTVHESLYPIVLVGMPGSGKSKIGRLLAKHLDCPHIDTDLLIVERQGHSISDIFAEQGEDVFRACERDAVREALEHRAVVSLGGGAVTSAEVRQMLEGHTVIFVDCDIDELVERVSRNTDRPLLRDDPRGMVSRLFSERRNYYEQVATLSVTSDASPVEGLVQRVLALLSQEQHIRVGGVRSYEVIVHPLDSVAQIRRALDSQTQRLLLIHSPHMREHSEFLARQLEASGYTCSLFAHPDGEDAKTVEVLALAWDAAAHAGLSRRDAIISVGGGATTDLAGFVAATWLRGVDVVHVPTTVLAMVDAAVGGKTGINTPAGKNLAGAFYPPKAVIADIALVESLPQAEVRAGLGEVAKCGFIVDQEILHLIETNDCQMLSASASPMMDLVVRAIKVKADIVSEDFTESGIREFLNYGHTLAHAIEKCENYAWRHGEAVAVGCVFAAELAYDRGLLSTEEVERHRMIFSRLGLPTSYSGASLAELTSAMYSDKKVRRGGLRFVLLDGIGNPVTVSVSEGELTDPARRIGIAV